MFRFLLGEGPKSAGEQRFTFRSRVDEAKGNLIRGGIREGTTSATHGSSQNVGCAEKDRREREKKSRVAGGEDCEAGEENGAKEERSGTSKRIKATY